MSEICSGFASPFVVCGEGNNFCSDACRLRRLLADSLDALENMIAVVDEVGGFLKPEHQILLVGARQQIERNGRPNRPRTKTWRDRR